MVHVTFSIAFTTHASVPFGAVSVREPTIEKLEADTSFTVASVVSDTRTLTVVLMESGTVHG